MELTKVLNKQNYQIIDIKDALNKRPYFKILASKKDLNILDKMESIFDSDRASNIFSMVVCTSAALYMVGQVIRFLWN